MMLWYGQTPEWHFANQLSGTRYDQLTETGKEIANILIKNNLLFLTDLGVLSVP